MGNCVSDKSIFTIEIINNFVLKDNNFNNYLSDDIRDAFFRVLHDNGIRVNYEKYKGPYEAVNNIIFYGKFNIHNIIYKGFIYKKNNYIYYGDITNNIENGSGIMLDITKKYYYTGEFKNGYFNGYGIIVYPDSYTYKGEFSNSLYNGFGTEVYPDGTIFKGQFKNNKKHGLGNYNWANSDTFKGIIKNDKLNNGKYFWKSKNRKYIGSFNTNTNFEGYGEFYDLTKNIVYKGVYKNGKKEGYGEENNINLNLLYKGEFKDNQKNGFGKLYKNEKIIESGIFKNDILITTINFEA